MQLRCIFIALTVPLVSGCAPSIEFEVQALPGISGYAGSGTRSVEALPGGLLRCFNAADSGDMPAATVEYTIEVVDEVSAVHARVTLSPAFVDNSYGETAIGWEHPRRGHSFSDLYKSDQAELIFTSSKGEEVLRFKQDYLSEAKSAPSGFASLGIGGDGELITGIPSWIVATSTSMDRNLNERGYASYAVDSPPTDADYTPSSEAPDWDYRVVYEAWVDKVAFSSAGFGSVNLESVHASPSKLGSDTLEVFPAPCPSTWIR